MVLERSYHRGFEKWAHMTSKMDRFHVDGSLFLFNIPYLIEMHLYYMFFSKICLHDVQNGHISLPIDDRS